MNGETCRCNCADLLAVARRFCCPPPRGHGPASSPLSQARDGFVCRGPEALDQTNGKYASDRRYYNVSRPTLTLHPLLTEAAQPS
jgi:hypothetical protein